MNAEVVIQAAFRGAVGDFALEAAFDAPMQGITTLFGPSGCGKTTLLRCVAGLTNLPGRLSVGGEVWQDEAGTVFRKPHQRSIGYVFQEPSLFRHLSVRQNLLFGAQRAITPDNGTIGFDDTVDLLGVRNLLDRAATALSGGERQRVAIGRAMLSQPRLMLMDEPLNALDRAAKDELLPYLEALHASLSIPILYVSHDIAEVVRLADRMVLLSKGRVLADGPVSEMLERLDLGPATGRFEAGVVLTARITGQDLDYRLTTLDLNGQTISVPETDLSIGDTVRLRIRARDVSIGTQQPDAISIRNILAGTVAEIRDEPDTAFSEILVDVGGSKLRARLTRKSVVELALIPGRPVFALIKSIAFDGRAIAAGTGSLPSKVRS